MTDPFRSDVECLRADNARLTARVAELESPPTPAKVPMKWVVLYENDRDSPSIAGLAIGFIIVVSYAVVAAFTFVVWGHVPMTSPIEQRGAIVFAILAALWCLAFVRRVPK